MSCQVFSDVRDVTDPQVLRVEVHPRREVRDDESFWG